MERIEMNNYLEKNKSNDMCVFLKNDKMLFGKIISWDDDGFTIRERDKQENVTCYCNMDWVLTIKVDDPDKKFKNQPPKDYNRY